ncbi:MAG: AbrB/MazE/SpoVT family DNA-binding domain-containing protein [Elusimicrobia bacterium]|nr:AbrB/MazE/SpoVT family DNA-binding domain-containing protein [Candidatus Obscuribacterium magneticum]
MLAKLTYKNQITLPKEVVKEFAGIVYFDVTSQGKSIILRPVTVEPSEDKLAKVREKIKSLGLTEADIDGAIRWARKQT